MVLIKQSELDALEGADYIVFEVNGEIGNPRRKYLAVLEKIAVACTGKRRWRRITDIKDLPLTKVGESAGPFVVHVKGSYNNVKLDMKLMGSKSSNYLLAILRNGKWSEVKFTELPIEGAEKLGFRGSYTELGVNGLAEPDCPVELGFDHLMQALIMLNNGFYNRVYFLKVVVNLFEAARFYEVGKLVINNFYISVKVPHYIRFLIGSWGEISQPVRHYKANGFWKTFSSWLSTDDAGVTYDMETKVNATTILTILRFGKQIEFGRTDPWS